MKQKPTLTPLMIRLRERRLELRISQATLAKVLGVTTQQYSKYDRGENEIKSSHLLKLAAALDLSLEELGLSGPDETLIPPPISNEETFALIKAWKRIPSEEVRRGLIVAIAAIAGQQSKIP